MVHHRESCIVSDDSDRRCWADDLVLNLAHFWLNDKLAAGAVATKFLHLCGGRKTSNQFLLMKT